jgi:PAS domain-containing protein
MSEVVGRVLSLLLGLALGALGGWIGGALVDAAGVGALLGAGIGLAVVTAMDTLRAERMLRWLRRSSVDSSSVIGPRDPGMWGEMAYRAEKALRTREHETAAERERLSQFLEAIEASPNGVLLLDANERIEWCNARAAEHFGLDPQRDHRQLVTNLLRTPAFVEYLQGGAYDAPIDIYDFECVKKCSTWDQFLCSFGFSVSRDPGPFDPNPSPPARADRAGPGPGGGAALRRFNECPGQVAYQECKRKCDNCKKRGGCFCEKE